MKTARQRVLDTIHAQRAVTATDLSHLLEMTEANARHHLRALEGQGLVVRLGERVPHGKGRPSQVFSLSETVLEIRDFLSGEFEPVPLADVLDWLKAREGRGLVKLTEQPARK